MCNPSQLNSLFFLRIRHGAKLLPHSRTLPLDFPMILKDLTLEVSLFNENK